MVRPMENQVPTPAVDPQVPAADPVVESNPITDFLLSNADPVQAPVTDPVTPPVTDPAATTPTPTAVPVVPASGDAALRQDLESFKREQSMKDFLNSPDKADYKTYEAQIKALASRPETKNLTITAIANMVVPKDFWIKRGAEMAEKAALESQQGYSGGSSPRQTNGGTEGGALPDPNSMDKATFEATAWKIARGN